MNLRKKLFQIKDKILNNSLILDHLKDLDSHYFDFNNPINLRVREERLSKILNYAHENVPYYNKLLNLEITSFPVINKSIIKENYSKFISKEFDLNDLKFVTTSGSTGTPFKSYRDVGKISRHVADNIFFNNLAGADIGFKLYYFRVWNNINKKNYFTKVSQNIETIDASNFSIDYIKSFVSEIEKDNQEKYFLSYASSYEAMVEVMKSINISRVNSKVNCILSMSETLPNPVRDYLEKVFSTKVVSRYSNMENGFIAQQCIENKEEYHLNNGSYLVEVLSLDGDFPANENEIGRIVVTDLFNHAMPFIRYDTGDLGVKSTSNCSCKAPVLSRVEGRKTDFVYATDGQMLSPHVITNTMWIFADIKQFQFIQKGQFEYLLKINSKDFLDENKVYNEFKSFLGSDANIKIEYVSEIPLLSSGKRKKIVNEYKKV
jgi:phenylacetate-CoA ligase